MYQNSRLRRPSLPPPRRLAKSPFVMLVIILIVLATGAFFLAYKPSAVQITDGTKPSAASFDKQQYSLDDPASPWVVVNKQRPLSPKTYEPSQLVAPNVRLEAATTSPSMQLAPEAAQALEGLDQAAQAAAGVELIVLSAYRSYATQTAVYDSEVRAYGQAQADRESARPGHSEHQTGWAVDLGAVNGKCRIATCFGDTSEGKWLAANAYKHGFIIRYAEGKEHVTGYQYEPWHLRYVGKELAAEMHRTNTLTPEKFFGLPAATTY